MKPWKRLAPTTVTKVGWRTIVTKTFEAPDGTQKTYDTIHPEDIEFAVTLAFDKDDNVVLARQFRPGPEKIYYDLPGGYIDEGETPEQAARRELLEETGYEAETMEYLGEFYNDCYFNAKTHAYLGLNCKKVAEQNTDEHEIIETVVLPINEFLIKAKQGLMTDHAVIVMAMDTILAKQKEKE